MKICGSELADNRDFGGMLAVADRERTIEIDAVRRVSQRCLRAEGDIPEIDYVIAAKSRNVSGEAGRLIQLQCAIRAAENEIGCAGDGNIDARAFGDRDRGGNSGVGFGQSLGERGMSVGQTSMYCPAPWVNPISNNC